MIKKYSKIIGTGSYLPEKKVSNQDLADELAKKNIETSDEWIVERTGIKFRHFVTNENENSSDLALKASLKAIEDAKLQADKIDLIIVATSTPDMVFPSTACILQDKLKIKNGCPAFDVQAVCCGFIYALVVADSMVKAGISKNALVVGAEVFSRILDFNDRSTCVLFGDGAGAVVLQASDEAGILASDLNSDGSLVDILKVPGTVCGGKVFGSPLLTMDGKAVFKIAVDVLGKTAIKTLTKANLTSQDIDWLIPHQANLRIISSTVKKLKLSLDKVIITVAEHGNTSAASIPLALDFGLRTGKIQKNQNILLEGVGGGFTWGSILLKM